MSETTPCSQCGRPLNDSDAFCPACGLAREEPWDGLGGFVENGRWWRPDGEFVRRIGLDTMKKGLLRSSVLVPSGSIGVVSVDGEVVEILRPGKRTTVTWLDRLADLVTDRLERTSFYLLDLRPIPVPVRLQAPVPGGDRTVEATATLLASIDRSDKTTLGTFLQAVVRERDTVSQKDLHLLLSGRATQRIRQLVVEGLARTPEDFVGVSRQVAAQLDDELGQRFGLELELLIELDTVRSLELRLGQGDSPASRFCTAEGCGQEMPASAVHCPACGTDQPLVPRRCGACGAGISPENNFCTECGERYAPPPAQERPLFTSDGKAVELDLVVRVEGLSDEATAERVRDAAATLVGSTLRRLRLAALTSPEGFQALGESLTAELAPALGSTGVRVRQVAVLDLRSKDGQWLLDARADLERRRQQMLVGREWLGAEGEALDLRELAWGVTLRRQQLELTEAFDNRRVLLEAREREQALADRDAALEAREAERRAQGEIARGDAERLARRHRQQEEHQDALEEAGRERQLGGEQLETRIGEEQRLREHGAEGERLRVELDSERARRTADDKLYEERSQQDLQLEKLRQMAELDREIGDADHTREMERRRAEHQHRLALADKDLDEAQLLALQAAELANTEHGAAAFAALEGARVAAVRDEATAALLAQAKEAREDLKDLVQTALGAQGRAQQDVTAMADRGLAAMAEVRAASVTPAPVVAAVGTSAATGPAPRCRECSQELLPPYRFCGRCGTSQED
jgi:predicted amidophosphoribosyltransferase